MLLHRRIVEQFQMSGRMIEKTGRLTPWIGLIGMMDGWGLVFGDGGEYEVWRERSPGEEAQGVNTDLTQL